MIASLASLWNLFRAEYLKVTGNRGIAIGLVWIFPLGGGIGMLLSILIMLGLPPQYRGGMNMSEALLSPWTVPGSELGRLLMLALTATVFAGEYQWGTWKNLVPRRQRTLLALVKFVAVSALMLVAFTLMSLVLWVSGALMCAVAGTPYEFGMTFETFVQSFLIQLFLAFTVTLIGAGYAAVAAIFSRAILGGIVIGIGMVIMELVGPALFALLGNFLRVPQLAVVYLYTPGYNINNVTWWLRMNRPMEMGSNLSQYAAPHALNTSLFILGVWVVGLISLTVILFRRQDITT